MGGWESDVGRSGRQHSGCLVVGGWPKVDSCGQGGVQKWSKMCGHPSWMAPRRDNTPDHTPDRNIQNKYCCNSTRHFFNAPDISFA